jgi:ABC-type glycerol-3-phosphate transport system permease component
MDKWWWLDWPPWRWSREEQNAVSQLGLAAGGVFILLSIPQLLFLGGAVWNSTLIALVTTVVTLVVSLFLARPICNTFWPEVIRAGDEKAAARLAAQESNE